jgi:hypothetical protein
MFDEDILQEIQIENDIWPLDTTLSELLGTTDRLNGARDDEQESHAQPRDQAKISEEANANFASTSEVVQNLPNSLSQVGEGPSDHILTFEKQSFDDNGSFKIFENDVFEVYVMKTYHKRQTNFKFEDAMFQVKIKIKDKSRSPLLKDILDTIESIITFALSSLKSYLDFTHENICYLTMFQKPMTRGIKSSPFNFKDGSAKGTSNLLSKLNRYLVSNNELTLNESFIIYVNILSLTHTQFVKKKKKAFTFGAPKNKNKTEFQNYWCIDTANTGEKSFEKKCLLLSCILANLQFNFFLSNKTDKRFLYASNINSNFTNKKSQAVSILSKELETLLRHLNLNNFQENLDFALMKKF